MSQRKCKQNSKTCEPRTSHGVLLSNIVVKLRNAHEKDHHSVNFGVSCRSSVLVPAGVNMQNVRDGNFAGFSLVDETKVVYRAVGLINRL